MGTTVTQSRYKGWWIEERHTSELGWSSFVVFGPDGKENHKSFRGLEGAERYIEDMVQGDGDDGDVKG